MRIASVTMPENVYSQKRAALLFLTICLISWSPVVRSSEWETEVTNSPPVPEIDLDDIHEQARATATGSDSSNWEETPQDSQTNGLMTNRSEQEDVDASESTEKLDADEATPEQYILTEPNVDYDTADDWQHAGEQIEEAVNNDDSVGVVHELDENLDSSQPADESSNESNQHEEMREHQSIDQPTMEDPTAIAGVDSSSDSMEQGSDILVDESLTDAESVDSEATRLEASDHLSEETQELPESSSQDPDVESIQTVPEEDQVPNSEMEKEKDTDETPPEGSLASFMQKLKAKEGPNPSASSTAPTQTTSSFEALASQQEQLNDFVEAQQAAFQANNEALQDIEPEATPLPETPDDGHSESIPEAADTAEEQVAADEAPEGSLASFMQKFKGNQGHAKANPLAAATSFEALANQQQQLNEHLAGQTNNYQPPATKEATQTQQSLEEIEHEYSGAPWGVPSAGLGRHVPDMELLYLYFQDQVRRDVGIPVASSYTEALFPLGVGTGLDVDGMNAGWKKAYRDELLALIAAPWNNVGGEARANEPPSPLGNVVDHDYESNPYTSEEKDLMDDLDDIGKFFQGVNAPDELDVGAASGSSMQELIMSKSRQLLVQQAKKGYDMIRRLWNGDSSEDDNEWDDDEASAWSVRNVFQAGAGAVRWVTNVVMDIVEGGDGDSSGGKDVGSDMAMKDYPRVNLEEIRKLSQQGLRNDEN